jgi:hypothetical protein
LVHRGRPDGTAPLWRWPADARAGRHDVIGGARWPSASLWDVASLAGAVAG